MEMTLSKGRDGWKAQNRVELENGRLLEIVTSKSIRGGLTTRASCYLVKGGFLTHVLFGDYSATVATSPARCTEKAVADLHRQALGKLDEVKAAVMSFYAAKGE